MGVWRTEEEEGKREREKRLQKTTQKQKEERERKKKRKIMRLQRRCGSCVKKVMNTLTSTTTTAVMGGGVSSSSSSRRRSSVGGAFLSSSILEEQQQFQQRRSMGLFATSSSSSSSSASASGLVGKMRLMSTSSSSDDGDGDEDGKESTSVTTTETEGGDTSTSQEEEEKEEMKAKSESESLSAATTPTTTTSTSTPQKRTLKKFVPMFKRAKEEGLKDDSGHLGLRNLPQGVAANDLRKLFSKFGEIRSVKSIRPDGEKPRAHIRFRSLADAEKALEALRSEEGIMIGPSKTPAEIKWEGRLKRKEEGEAAGEGEETSPSSEEDVVGGDDKNHDGMRKIKGEIYDPTKPKQSEVVAEMRRERKEGSYVVRNTRIVNTQESEPSIRTVQEEKEEQTKMVVHKDPLEGIDTSGMTPLEIRKLTLQKRREQRQEHFAKQKRVAEMKQKVMKDMRSERLADGAMKARSYVPRYKRDGDGNALSASDTDVSLPSLQVRDQRTRRAAAFGGKTFELRKRNAAAGSGQQQGRREKNPENDRIKRLLRERVDAAKKMQTDGVELDYDVARLEKDMQMRFGEYTSWPVGMDQKPWIFGEKDPNEDVSPGDYLDSKKAFVMEQLNLTSDSQYESLKKDSLEEFEKMLAKEKYRTESFGESPAEDVFEHRKIMFDMARGAVDNEKNPLHKFAQRAASILDANPGWSFGKKKKLFDRLSIDAKQFDDWEEEQDESSTNQKQ